LAALQNAICIPTLSSDTNAPSNRSGSTRPSAPAMSMGRFGSIRHGRHRLGGGQGTQAGRCIAGRCAQLCPRCVRHRYDSITATIDWSFE
jgi:hypothetical protein